MLKSVEIDPLGVTRIYTAPDFRVRERIATHAKHQVFSSVLPWKVAVIFIFKFTFSRRSI
jgi:hypothetical protein